jgi:hypothetical protein
MKLWLAAAAAALVLLPGLASAQLTLGGGHEEEEEIRKINAHPAECARLNRQIDHFMGMYMRAEAAANEMWASRLQTHIELLLGMQATRCPDDVPVDEAGEAFKEFLKFAAKAAVAYFTFGAAGF